MRAAMSACKLSGTRSAASLPEPASMIMRIVSSTNSVAFGALEQLARAGRHRSRRACELCEQLLDEQLASSSVSGSSSIAVERTRLHPILVAPRAARVARAGRSARRAHEVGEMLDQVERCSARWMSSNRRINGWTSAMPCMTSLPRRSPASSAHPRALHEACGQPEDVCGGLLRTALAKLLERLLERVVVRDTRSGSTISASGQYVTPSLPQRAAHENACTLEAVEELACAAFPDPGLP